MFRNRISQKRSAQHAISNVHAHNCRGVVLSWAKLGQEGTRHINNHRPEYVVALFAGLGYRMRKGASAWLRRRASPSDASMTQLFGLLAAPSDALAAWHEGTAIHPWFAKTVYVFERLEPACVSLAS